MGNVLESIQPCECPHEKPERREGSSEEKIIDLDARNWVKRLYEATDVWPKSSCKEAIGCNQCNDRYQDTLGSNSDDIDVNSRKQNLEKRTCSSRERVNYIRMKYKLAERDYNSRKYSAEHLLDLTLAKQEREKGRRRKKERKEKYANMMSGVIVLQK
ncbi:uncharacterized protein LOC116612985 [Nematostella vectensis]|uniref:uncharacterized protein LOC116612985 n=1 Tax=Nematostella vectensis TaxID=45351 RepID=UPI00138FABF1|nr:uncharacterized protein LOC116612985 [Nematostella vectensis]